MVSDRTPTAAPARPLRKDAERNRRRLLRAADAVFAADGLSATFEKIADRADVGVGTLYRRFPDRESLIEALFEDKVAAVSRVAEEALADPDPWAGFCAFLRHAAAEHAADRGLVEVLLGSEYARQRVTAARARMLPLVTRLVERAQAAGAVRPDFSPHDVPMIILMVSSVAARTGPSGCWERYLELLLDSLRPGPGRALTVPPPGPADGC